MSISKKQRFEIFKRDHFICQYCGRTPPEAILEVDHIVPRVSQGTDEESNLITSCFECNRGKGATGISPNALPLESRIDVIREREDQLQAYCEAQKEGYMRMEKNVEMVYEHYHKLAGEKSELGTEFIISIRNLLRTFTVIDIIEAMNVSMASIGFKDGWFRYMCGVLWNWKRGVGRSREKKKYIT